MQRIPDSIKAACFSTKALMLVAGLLLSACGQDPITPSTTGQPVVSIAVNPNGISTGVTLTANHNYTMLEQNPNSFIQFFVSLDKAVSTEVSFTIQLDNQRTQATLEQDYRIQANSYVQGKVVTIPANSFGADFTIEVIDDLTYDPDEKFSIYFTLLKGATLSSDAVAGYHFAITDNEIPPVLTLQTADPSNSGTIGSIANISEGAGSVELILTLPSNYEFDGPTQVDCEIIPGTATEGVDFLNPCPLTFPGNNQATILQLGIINDIENDPNGNETFQLRILDPIDPNAAYSVDPGINTISVTIIDDDASWTDVDTAADTCIDATGKKAGCAGVDPSYPVAQQDVGTTLPNVNYTPFDACVIDPSGLMWELKSNTPDHIQHGDSLFSWYVPHANQNGGEEGTQGDNSSCRGAGGGFICDTNSYIQKINSDGLCGLADGSWRLPTLRELQTLVHYGASATTSDIRINTSVFGNTSVSTPVGNLLYWTSTPTALLNEVWVVDMLSGNAYSVNPAVADYAGKARIRLVRKN